MLCLLWRKYLGHICLFTKYYINSLIVNSKGVFMRKIFALFLCIFAINIPVNAEEPQVKAAAAVLAEKESGRVLWERNGDMPMAPASTTKIMTAIVVLENSPLDRVIEADKLACAAPKVRMGLKAGERISVEQLLYALMLQSSNDAAVALAVGVGGSVENFCDMMNKKAAAIGCTNTFFVTPNGLDKGDHHTTARDMAKMAAYALDNKEFCRIIQTKNVNFKTDKASYSIYNHDRFLSEYNGALGIKTGFTGKAGHCFAGAAKRGDMTLVSVVFASGWGNAGKEAKWSDTKALMNFGFENFSYKKIIDKGDLVRISGVKNGSEKTARLVYANDFSTALKPDEKITVKFKLPPFLKAPVKAGENVGCADITVNGEFVGTVPVCVKEDIEKIGFWENFKVVAKMWVM